MSLAELKKAYPWIVPKIPEPIPFVKRERHGFQHILSLLEKTQNPIILELGSEFGSSAITFIQKLQNPTVICLDKWSVRTYKTPLLWKKLSKYTGSRQYGTWSIFAHQCFSYRDQIIPIRGDRLKGMQIVSKFEVKPDLVYVDCIHLYEQVTEDLELANNLFPQAILCGDDLNIKKGLPVKRAVTDFCENHGFKYRIYENQYVILKTN